MNKTIMLNHGINIKLVQDSHKLISLAGLKKVLLHKFIIIFCSYFEPLKFKENA